MKRLSILACVAAAALIAADTAFAQFIPPGGSQFNPPLPPPPPPPKIEVPVVPQMDTPPRQNYLPAPRPSFGDRITTCLEEGATAGLGPGDREEYSRNCANR
ncbi:hypothetical protein [Bradyrhizobium sp.]|uniref:hypothetical protein n=1 Tax=Bradyrhizobium sp. TaxID=376 RepID=UPI003C77BD9E